MLDRSLLTALIVLFVGDGAFGICRNKFGVTCLTRVDQGAGVYFDYFKWNSTCFPYQDGHYCMVRLGYLQPCKCSQECGCEGKEKETQDTMKLKCDSSSVKDYEGCSDIKKTFCPLTTKGSGSVQQNTLCQYCGENKKNCGEKICQSDIVSQEEKDEIVGIHNNLRSRVARGEEKRGVGGSQPPASNMNQLVWDNDLALSAQMWALQCPNNHDQNRLTPEFNNYPYVWVGQNLAFLWSSSLTKSKNYTEMITGWYDEVRDFPPQNVGSYTSQGARGVIGHYTTMIWASSTKIGCGFVHHFDTSQPNNPYKKTLVCNYGEGGNILGREVYKIGKPGSACPNGSKNGLCL